MSTRTNGKIDLLGRVARHPYQAMLVAAGVGYILAGGLFTRLTLNMLRVGVRMGALPILQRKLLGAADATQDKRSFTTSSERDDPTKTEWRAP